MMAFAFPAPDLIRGLPVSEQTPDQVRGRGEFNP